MAGRKKGKISTTIKSERIKASRLFGITIPGTKSGMENAINYINESVIKQGGRDYEKFSGSSSFPRTRKKLIFAGEYYPEQERKSIHIKKLKTPRRMTVGEIRKLIVHVMSRYPEAKTIIGRGYKKGQFIRALDLTRPAIKRLGRSVTTTIKKVD